MKLSESKFAELMIDLGGVLRRYLIPSDPFKDQRDKHKAARKDCPHTQGCLGLKMPGAAGTYLGGRTSIWWHTFEDDPKHKVGICVSCGRQFRFGDKDYKEWLDKPSAGVPSTGGLRVMESNAKPHMAGSPISVSRTLGGVPAPDGVIRFQDLASGEKTEDGRTVGEFSLPLVDEPPIDMTLNEFLLTEILKRYPERAAELLMGSVVALKHLKPLTGARS